ncbi:MAG: bifunctional metallophosphatase/5'-nucleotidase [Ginsengibacter sp.]
MLKSLEIKSFIKRFFSVQMLIVFCFSQELFAQSSKDTMCILQLNDVYEIAPLEHGSIGGMARVATIVKQHEARYKTFVVVAGDFVSPSVIGTTKMDGQRVSGKHMVDMMNKCGVDLVIFGNHEFDIPENDLQQRINESKFAWVSSDVLHKHADGTVTPFYKTLPDSSAIPISTTFTSANDQFKVGIVSATISINKQPWVEYRDNLEYFKKAWRKERRESDIVIGLTHLKLADDENILRKIKKIPLIMGGHEHKHNYVKIRKGFVAKADANAKTMYRHLLFRDEKTKKIKIISKLLAVDSTVVQDKAIALAVKQWEDKAYEAFRASGLEPDAVVYHTKEPLDGTGENIRYKQTNLGTIIANAFVATSTEAEAAFFNSGSIRIDDIIDGTMTQLDVIRTLPFGGKLCEVDLTGALLNQTLTAANNLKGSGAFLQLSTDITFKDGKWMIKGAIIEPAKIYKIASTDYLFGGNEKGLEFLKEGNADIKFIKHFDAPGDVHTDVRLAVVKYLSDLEGR